MVIYFNAFLHKSIIFYSCKEVKIGVPFFRIFDRDLSMLFKGVAIGLSVLAIALIMIFGCENSNGPAPTYLCGHQYDSLLLIVRTEQGQVPMGPAIPLDSLKNLMVTDSGVKAIVNMPEYKDKQFYTKIGKIVFK
jgi:hypothetical protein